MKSLMLMSRFSSVIGFPIAGVKSFFFFYFSHSLFYSMLFYMRRASLAGVCQKSVSSIKLARRVAPPMRHQLGAIPQFGTVQSIFASVTLFLPYIYPVIDSRTLARLLLVDVQSRFARPVRSARCHPRRAFAALF